MAETAIQPGFGRTSVAVPVPLVILPGSPVVVAALVAAVIEAGCLVDMLAEAGLDPVWVAWMAEWVAGWVEPTAVTAT